MTTTNAPESNLVERRWKLGDLVQKKRNSYWRGEIVGFYSTVSTPAGYSVMSHFEPGSVQVWPEAALEDWDGSGTPEQLADEITRLRERVAELEGEAEPKFNKISTYFMTDMHTFIALEGSPEEMVDEATRLIHQVHYEGESDGIPVGSYGSLCPVILSAPNGKERRVGPMIHAGPGNAKSAKKFYDQAQEWIKTLRADEGVMSLLDARQALKEKQP